MGVPKMEMGWKGSGQQRILTVVFKKEFIEAIEIAHFLKTKLQNLWDFFKPNSENPGWIQGFGH